MLTRTYLDYSEDSNEMSIDEAVFRLKEILEVGRLIFRDDIAIKMAISALEKQSKTEA